ncbi:MAG: FAD-dependent monooxygenase [Ferruginibacter sp.]|nr:FAD-dependent monooxygenase [Chitinophagaceae bacterium]
MQQTQVIIIGAGPTGLSLAVQLLRYNIDFIILEKNKKITHLSKAVVVQARTLEIFHESGLATKAIEQGRLTTAFNMFYKGKKRLRLDVAGLGEGLSHFPFALSLEQSKTEKLLADHLTEKGKSIHWGSEFTRFEQTPDGVTVYYKDATGAEQTIEGAYMVGCDGSRSPVRHQSGQTFEGDTVPKLFYVTDVRLTSPVVNTDELFIFLIKKGFILFFPMEGTGHYRIIGILPDHTEDDTVTFDTIKEEVTRQLVSPVHFEEVLWFSTYKVHSRKAGSFRNARCFIAGDAGHIHTPAGGQGMNTGIQDAYNLAWKLAYTINHHANDTVLESYNTERTGNAAQLLRTTDRMFEAMTGANRFLNFLRLNVFPAVAGFLLKSKTFNKRVFPLLSMTSIAYPGSSLTLPSAVGKIKAGQRMPYFIFSDGKNIYDYISAPGFKILYFGKEDQAGHTQLQKIKFPVSLVSFSEIPKSLFRNETGFYILLRPDNHIAYLGKDLHRCIDFLETLTRNGR